MSYSSHSEDGLSDLGSDSGDSSNDLNNDSDDDNEPSSSSIPQGWHHEEEDVDTLETNGLLMPSSPTRPAANILQHTPRPITNLNGPHNPSERSPLLPAVSISFRDAPEILAAGGGHSGTHVSTVTGVTSSPELRGVRLKTSAQRLNLGRRRSSEPLASAPAREPKETMGRVTGNSTFGQSVGYLFSLISFLD